MAIPRNYVFQDGGVFVSYHQKLGTLLDIINIVKKCQGNKFCIEPMAVFFTIELLGMVDALHTAGIVHADLKADNLLLQVGQTYEDKIIIIVFVFIRAFPFWTHRPPQQRRCSVETPLPFSS